MRTSSRWLPRVVDAVPSFLVARGGTHRGTAQPGSRYLEAAVRVWIPWMGPAASSVSSWSRRWDRVGAGIGKMVKIVVVRIALAADDWKDKMEKESMGGRGTSTTSAQWAVILRPMSVEEVDRASD